MSRNKVRLDVDDKPLKSALSQLGGAFGKSSALGKVEKLLLGGGAIWGLSHAAKLIGDMATNAGNLAREFSQGKISAGEMASKLVDSLPVVGQFAQAGRAIREAFTGEQAAVERMNDEAKKTGVILDARIAGMKQAKEAAQELLATIRQIREETALVRMTGLARDLEEVNQREGADTRKIEQQAKEAADKVKEAYEPGLKAWKEAMAHPPEPDDEEGQASFRAQQSFGGGMQREMQERLDNIEKLKRAAIVAERAKAATQREVAQQQDAEERRAKGRAAAAGAEGDAADTEGQARRTRLSNQGLPFEADADEVKTALAKKLAEIRKSTAEEAALYDQSDRDGLSKVRERGERREAAAVALAREQEEKIRQAQAEAVAQEAKEAAGEADQAAEKEAQAEERKLAAAARMKEATEDTTFHLRKQREEVEQLAGSFTSMSSVWQKTQEGVMRDWAERRKAGRKVKGLLDEHAQIADHADAVEKAQRAEEAGVQKLVDSTPKGKDKLREVRQKALDELKEKHARERKPLEHMARENAEELEDAQDAMRSAPAAAPAAAGAMAARLAAARAKVKEAAGKWKDAGDRESRKAAWDEMQAAKAAAAAVQRGDPLGMGDGPGKVAKVESPHFVAMAASLKKIANSVPLGSYVV